MPTMRYDRTPIKATRTDEGYIIDTPVLTRTGIFEYRDAATGKIRLEYRPPAAVFAQDSLRAYKTLPITDGHPGRVNSSNVKPHLCGTITSEGRQDGDNVVAEVVIHDTGPILAGKEELSVGYEVVLDETPGTTPDGKRYDAIQTSIKPNHLAIVAKGRAGNARLNLDASDDANLDDGAPKMTMVKVRLDSTGQSYDAAPEVANEVEKLRADLAAANAAKDTATARADSLQSDLDKAKADTDKVRQDAANAARARIELEAKAKELGVTFAQDASDRVIREAIIKHVRGATFNMDGKSDDYVNAAFDLAVVEKAAKVDNVARTRQTMNQDAGNGGTNQQDGSAAGARARLIEQQRKHAQVSATN